MREYVSRTRNRKYRKSFPGRWIQGGDYDDGGFLEREGEEVLANHGE